MDGLYAPRQAGKGPDTHTAPVDERNSPQEEAVCHPRRRGNDSIACKGSWEGQSLIGGWLSAVPISNAPVNNLTVLPYTLLMPVHGAKQARTEPSGALSQNQFFRTVCQVKLSHPEQTQVRGGSQTQHCF